jgi:hypothetical protein
MEYIETLEARKKDLLQVKNNELLEYSKVFFVHYQCDDFNVSKQIKALCIYKNGKAKEYIGNEAENIKEYATEVKELLNKGLFLVHWNQDRTYYGTDHINERYKDITGESLELEYQNEINLAELLVFKYGQDYISHPRLDKLAILNEFFGIRETEFGQQTFSTNRIMLLTKIYFNALNNTLKTALTPQQPKTKTDKIKAPILGLFCSLINKINIDKKDETESATVYCERICGKFKLPYTDRVRQNYNVNETKKLMKELTEKVLPLIDIETKNLIQEYIDTKQPPKQNLYG